MEAFLCVQHIPNALKTYPRAYKSKTLQKMYKGNLRLSARQ